MEFILISESKLKIIISAEEAVEYGIESITPDCTDPVCRRAVWSILDKAKREVGFDPGGDKVLLQFYHLKGSECEVFITKLGILSSASARVVARSDKIAMLSRERKLYAFDTRELLSLCCEAIKNRVGFAPHGDVYTIDGERYFLSIEEYGKGGETVEFPQILEFGRGLSAEYELYLSEHAKRLSDGDGVERFSLRKAEP